MVSSVDSKEDLVGLLRVILSGIESRFSVDIRFDDLVARNCGSAS